MPIAALTLAAAGPVQAQRAAAPPAGWEEFAELFDAEARRDSIVGGSVLVMRDGEVLGRHDYGFADRAAGVRVGARTIYHYGSITKTLTAIAIMQLRDRGRLSLDDRVTDYIPELRRVHDPYDAIDSISIRMLLSHSAGFQNPTWPYTQGESWEPFEPTTWNQLVAMMPYQKLHFRPGSRYSYSNPAFVYLGRIIEQLSGDPWEVYIQKNIFAPLRMTRSYFGYTPYYLAADRSNGYTVGRDSTGAVVVDDHGPEFNPGITMPNGGWNAPLADLATYLAFLTNATRGDSSARARYDVVLNHSSLEEMWQPLYATAGGGYASGDSVGLSFFTVPRENATLIGHTGTQAGFVSFMYLNPATSAAVVGVLNTDNTLDHSERPSAYEAIRQAALGLID